MSPQQRAAQMAKMRAARSADFANGLSRLAGRIELGRQVLGTINRSRLLRSISSTRAAISSKLIFSNSRSLAADSRN